MKVFLPLWLILALAQGQEATVGRYEVFEVILTSSRTYANPFLDVVVTATFRAPSGRELTANGFYDGGTTWRVRLAPDEVGEWRYVTHAIRGPASMTRDPSPVARVTSDERPATSDDSGLDSRSGTFRCAASRNRGFIRVDPKRLYSFSHSDGTPFFALGDTCSVTCRALSEKNRQEYLDARVGKPFNFLRVFASLTYNAWTGRPWGGAIAREADGFPWGGTPQTPDYDRLNPAYFQRYEKILGELHQRNVYAEIIVFNLYEVPFKDPAVWTPLREELWGRYVVSRLSAYTTVFLWTVAQEYERYPVGQYRYEPADDNWVRRMAKLIRASDPYSHPVTVHPVGDGGKPGEVGEVLMEGGVMGQRFGPGPELDVLSHQHNSYGTATWVPDPAPGYWDGPASGVEKAIWADRRFSKPVINTEYGYEGLEGDDINFNRQTHGTDKCRRAAWRIFTAGGAGLAAGFRGTTLSIDKAEIYYDKQQRFAPFRVADSGHVRQLQHLYDFVTVRTGFQDMSPAQALVNAPNLCLAYPGREYIVYAPDGGELNLDLAGASGSFSVAWLNPRTGAYDGRAWITGGAEQVFTSPDANDWVLHLTMVEDRSRADWQERLEAAARTPEAWRARREEIRQQILVAAGLWPPFERPPLEPVVTGQLERDGYTLKKVYLETWPGFYLTGLLYLPGKPGPLPAVLCTHGHGKNGRFGTVEEQPRAITLARLGFVVFAYDMIGYGECTQLPHEFADPPWGLNLLGLQLWNSLCVVDFVSSLPQVDPQRIGVTGSSGGGTQTYLLTAVDDRIACAAPVCMVAAEFQGGCSCENAPGLRIGLNNVEIAAATAPRPLLLVAATGDWTKYTPVLEGPALHGVYGALRVPDRFRCVQFVAPHNYNRDSREAVYPWFVHWLGPRSTDRDDGGLGRRAEPRGVAGTVSRVPSRFSPRPALLERWAELAVAAEPHENLEVFTPAHPRPDDAVDAAGLTALLKEKIRQQLASLWPRDNASLERFRQVMTPALRYTLGTQWPRPGQVELVAHAAPAAKRGRPDPRTLPAPAAAGHSASVVGEVPGREAPNAELRVGEAQDALTTGARVEAELFSRLTVRFRGLPGTIELSAGAPAGKRRCASLLVASTDEEVESILRELRHAEPAPVQGTVRCAPYLLRLRSHPQEPASGGTEEQQRQFVSTYYRTALAWQVQDVLTALAYLTEQAGFGEVRLVGFGEAGISALLARALEPTGKVSMTIADLAGLDGEDEKTWTGPRMQSGMLRLGSLRTVALLAAPGELILHHAGAQLDVAALHAVYRAAGRASTLEISASAWSVAGILQRIDRM